MSATLAIFKLPKVLNEPNAHYKKNSAERIALEQELTSMAANAPYYVPAFINGKNVSLPSLIRRPEIHHHWS